MRTSTQLFVMPGNSSANVSKPKFSNLNLRRDGPITLNTSYLSYTATRRPSVVHHIEFSITDMIIVTPKASADPKSMLEAIDETRSDLGSLSS